MGETMIPHTLPGMKRLGYFAQKQTCVNDKTPGSTGSNELARLANTNGAILCGLPQMPFREVVVHIDAKPTQMLERSDRESFSVISEPKLRLTVWLTRHSVRHDISRSTLLLPQAREPGSLP